MHDAGDEDAENLYITIAYAHNQGNWRSRPMFRNTVAPILYIDWYCYVAPRHTFKLRNMELSTFIVDVDQRGGHTLVSRRYAEGVTFTVDETTGRIQNAAGLCVHTGPGRLPVGHTCRFVSSETRVANATGLGPQRGLRK